MALFGGSKPKLQQLPLLTPQQQQLQNTAISQVLSMLQPGGSLTKGFDFAPIEQRARSQFQQQTIPSIAERFTSMGAGGQRSSAFQGALGQAGAGLEEALAALGSQYGLQQQQLQQNLFSNLLGAGQRPALENILIPGRAGLLESLLSALVGGGSRALGSYLGGF